MTIEEDNSITVKDNGRGIPVGIHEKMGRPAVEVIMTVLHAGGKFGGGGYKVSGGLHGVGASVVNALSTVLEVYVHREGKFIIKNLTEGSRVRILKLSGKPIIQVLQYILVRILKFSQKRLEYDFETLANRIRELAFLNRGIKITIEDKREEEEKIKEYHYEGGIKSYVEHLNRSKEVSTKNRSILKVNKTAYLSKLLCNIMTAISVMFFPLQIIFIRMKAEHMNQDF